MAPLICAPACRTAKENPRPLRKVSARYSAVALAPVERPWNRMVHSSDKRNKPLPISICTGLGTKPISLADAGDAAANEMPATAPTAHAAARDWATRIGPHRLLKAGNIISASVFVEP